MLQKRNPGLAGTLRERVTFQKRGLDDNGDALGEWVDQFDCPARVQAFMPRPAAATRVGETTRQDRLEGVQPAEITVRLNGYTALIDSDWRVVWRGWAFDLTAIAVDELASIVNVMGVRYRGGDLG